MVKTDSPNYVICYVVVSYLHHTLNVDESSVNRSVPANIQTSPGSHDTRKTPRTPHHKDSATAPRFYPVVKENKGPDPMVGLCFS